VCFRSNVWNIGAEGQFVVGALCAGLGGHAGRARHGMARPGIVVPILLAGMLGGMLWAAIVALLRDRFNANEILVSLMLVYVAEMLLSYLVYGPWKDPKGYNFPQTITFLPTDPDPAPGARLRAHIGVLIAAGGGGRVLGFLFRTYRVCAAGGRAGAGRGALCGLFVAQCAVDGAAVSGGMAGLAGGLEAAGPLGQLTPYVPAGYGFAAIIVAYVGGCTRWGSSVRAC
jgi:ABC-type uncharacterized transport system permease subunit